MGSVDAVKNARVRLIDWYLPQRFVFHHVPKCGGTSVGRALRRRYILSQATVTPEESFRAFEAFTGRVDREQMLVDVLDLREQMLLYNMFLDTRGISLHVRFSQAAWDRFGDRYKFVTIMREPVARFLSHYNWSHNKAHAHGRIDEDFEAFLETERAQRLGATFVEYYCGLSKDADIRSEPAIEGAISNLDKFAVVGDLADLAAFERDVHHQLGVRISIRHENKAPGTRRFVRAEDLSDTLMNRVRALCAPDLAVWQSRQFRSST